MVKQTKEQLVAELVKLTEIAEQHEKTISDVNKIDLTNPVDTDIFIKDFPVESLTIDALHEICKAIIKDKKLDLEKVEYDIAELKKRITCIDDTERTNMIENMTLVVLDLYESGWDDDDLDVKGIDKLTAELNKNIRKKHGYIF